MAWPAWQPGDAGPLPAGTILFYLDPPEEAPPEFAAKATRYGWPADADLVPVWLTGGPHGPADLDLDSVRRLTVGIAAVLAHDRRNRTTGTMGLATGEEGSYTIDGPAVP